MTNADKFREVFGIYATELWAKPENDFLKWLNADFARDIEMSDTRWISVDERLPEAYLNVLVCNLEGDIDISDGCYSTEIPGEWIWLTLNWRFGDVVAWMTLPPKYEG